MAKNYLVTNRSAGLVCYAIPEMGIKNREFQPGETKQISYEELTNLSYLPGGLTLIRDYLQVQDMEVRKELIGKTEPEYNMSVADIKDLILKGSMDEWLDCLDFAPDGVIDLIKNLSIELPLTNTEKMEAFKQKKDFDLARAIRAKKEDEEEAKAESAKAEKPVERRVKQEEAPIETSSVRRTSGSKYTIIKKEE